MLTLILERLEFLAYSMRVGSSFVSDSYYFSIDLLIFGWGSALLSPLLLVLFLINLWTDMVVPDLANSQAHPTD